MKPAVTTVMLVVFAAVGVAVACGSPAATAVGPPPAGLRAGTPWDVTIRPPRDASARFEIRQGARRRTFPLRRRQGASTARVVFPAAGRWTYGVRFEARFTRLGRATIAPRRLILAEPFGVVEVGGAILVSDRRANAVFRIAPDGSFRRVAAIPQARELHVLDGASVLVTSGPRVLRLDLATGATAPIATARDDVLGMARSADGALYLAEGGHSVVRVDPDGARTVVLSSRDGVHGLQLDGARLIVSESFAGNVLAVDLLGGRVATLARGLGNPSFTANAPEDALYISEFGSGRVSLLGADGRVRVVASVSQVGPLWLRADGSLLAVTLGGELLRIEPTTGRVRSLLR